MRTPRPTDGQCTSLIRRKRSYLHEPDFSYYYSPRGIALIVLGVQRRDSLAGSAQAAGDAIATKVDGTPRVTDHALYLAGGIVLVIIGGATLLRSPRN